jgi:hypothetical protein
MIISISARASNDSANRLFIHNSTKQGNSRILIYREAWIINGALRVCDMINVRNGVIKLFEGKPTDDEFAILSYIPQFELEGKYIDESFAITAHIPVDTFNYLLNLTNDQATIDIELGFDHLNTNIKQALCCGDDNDILWKLPNYTNSHFEIANEVEIMTSVKSKE